MLMMLTIIIYCNLGELSGSDTAKKLWFFKFSLCFYLICLRWHAGISNKISHSFHEDKSHWTTKKVYTHNRKLLVHGKDSIVESS